MQIIARKADQRNLVGQLAYARARLVRHENKEKPLHDDELAKLLEKIVSSVLL